MTNSKLIYKHNDIQIQQTTKFVEDIIYPHYSRHCATVNLERQVAAKLAEIGTYKLLENILPNIQPPSFDPGYDGGYDIGSPYSIKTYINIKNTIIPKSVLTYAIRPQDILILCEAWLNPYITAIKHILPGYYISSKLKDPICKTAKKAIYFDDLEQNEINNLPQNQIRFF